MRRNMTSTPSMAPCVPTSTDSGCDEHLQSRGDVYLAPTHHEPPRLATSARSPAKADSPPTGLSDPAANGKLAPSSALARPGTGPFSKSVPKRPVAGVQERIRTSRYVIAGQPQHILQRSNKPAGDLWRSLTGWSSALRPTSSTGPSAAGGRVPRRESLPVPGMQYSGTAGRELR
jgi:hypothetical protein